MNYSFFVLGWVGGRLLEFGGLVICSLFCFMVNNDGYFKCN